VQDTVRGLCWQQQQQYGALCGDRPLIVRQALNTPNPCFWSSTCTVPGAYTLHAGEVDMQKSCCVCAGRIAAGTLSAWTWLHMRQPHTTHPVACKPVRICCWLWCM
jgi:hypothetical protein